MDVADQWWGYSREHGWVVLDRTLACNRPGSRGNLVFLRCRDSKVITSKFEQWNPPEFRYAPNYLRELSGPAADEARARFAELQDEWPQMSAELKRLYQESLEAADERRRQIERMGETTGRR